jgi:Protein of unknown function (DUF1552)
MTVRPFRLTRRAALRGVAAGLTATVTLPRLEAMLGHHGDAYADGTPLPKLYATYFWGNGIDPKRWVPTSTGANWTLSEQLAPLAPVKDYVSVVTNATLTLPRGNEPHVSGPVGLLTGDDYEGTGFADATVKSISLDQIIANKISQGAQFKSIEVRIGKPHPGGTAITNISHNGPNNPNRGETDPKALFDRLFGATFVDPGATGAPMSSINDVRKSMLDLVADDAARLRPRLGTADKARLDQHVEGIRSLEQRLTTQAATVKGCSKPMPPVTAATLQAGNAVMSTLIAMALACDLTRVVSFEFTTPASHVFYPEININQDVHEWCHSHGVDDMVNKAIVYFVGNMNTFLSTLKSTADGAGNLLDRACVLGTSCTGYGPSHDTKDYPLVIAGRALGGLVHPGIHFRQATEDNASRVPLTLLKLMGAPAVSWGVGVLHADKPITELLT